MNENSNTVFLYDFLQVMGGAESVCLRLLEEYHQSRLIVGSIDESVFPRSVTHSLNIHNLGRHTRIQGWQSYKTSRAFLSGDFTLAKYKNAVFSGIYAPLTLLRERAQRNVYYCHTPPRFVYDLKDYYLDNMPNWMRPAFLGLVNWYRPKFEKSLEYADVIACNSENVRRRLRRFCQKESRVIYPPIAQDGYDFESSGDYFLSTARLEDYKRVEVVVKAFIDMPDKKLIVTSGGSDYEKLKKMASDAPNIQFTGWTTSESLQRLVNNAKATIYIPRDEDFGMSPVESMSAGKPVIAAKEGGLLETVIEGETGWFLEKPDDPRSLVELVDKIPKEDYLNLRQNCEKRAAYFSRQIFFESFDSLLVK